MRPRRSKKCFFKWKRDKNDFIIDDGKTVRFHLPSVWKQLEANRPRRRKLSI